jgi:hypothetical protein
MRDPVFPTDPVPAVTVFSGNQFQGGGNPGNQPQDDSAAPFSKQVPGTGYRCAWLNSEPLFGGSSWAVSR